MLHKATVAFSNDRMPVMSSAYMTQPQVLLQESVAALERREVTLNFFDEGGQEV